MAKELKKFKLGEVRRERCVGWNAGANGGKGGAITTRDCLDDNGNVSVEKCKALGIAPASATFLTVADLAPAFRESFKSASVAAAKDAGYSVEDYLYRLVISDAMQDAYNASVRAIRPVTDKAKERAATTLRTVLKSQGKSDSEIAAVLTAAGLV